MPRIIKTGLALLCLLCTLGTNAQSVNQAEELYRQGKFSDALQTYETLLKNTPNDPFVYYNIGNCYFKMGSIGLAAANYYRAFKLAPRDADIRNNLALALNAGGEKLVPNGIPAGMHKAFFYLSYPELEGLFLLTLWVCCLLGGVWFIKRRLGKAAFCALILLAVTGTWTYARRQLEREQLAVIASPLAELRSGPGTNFPASASITQGHLLTVQDQKDNWYEVTITSQGIKGWIDQTAVEKI